MTNSANALAGVRAKMLSPPPCSNPQPQRQSTTAAHSCGCSQEAENVMSHDRPAGPRLMIRVSTARRRPNGLLIGICLIIAAVRRNVFEWRPGIGILRVSVGILHHALLLIVIRIPESHASFQMPTRLLPSTRPTTMAGKICDIVSICRVFSGNNPPSNMRSGSPFPTVSRTHL